MKFKLMINKCKLFRSSKYEKLFPLEEVLLLTRGKCLLSFEPEKSNNRMTYHHIVKKSNGGEKSFHNGAPLLKSNHEFLNKIEVFDIGLYYEINYGFDNIKQALEMYDVLRSLFPENAVQDIDFELEASDLSLEDENIDEEVIVEDMSLDQLREVRKAILLYQKEVVPAFQSLKNAYLDKEANYKLAIKKEREIKKKEKLPYKNNKKKKNKKIRK